jgi:hypothetical protein
MTPFDPSRSDLRDAFRARPFGRHGAELQALLNLMRSGEHGMNLLLVHVAWDRWLLAERLPDGAPPRLVPGKVYRSRIEAELDVFDMRWARLAGLAGGEYGP